MISVKNSTYITPEAYLDHERHSPIKHEYIDGEVYAMAGATKAHNIISLNLAFLLRTALKGSPCQIFMADVKVSISNHISNQKKYFYPDLVVTCNENEDLNAYTIEFPKVIIEVLSESTESFDRGKKFQYYRTIPSLQDYILVSSQEYLVETFHRTENNLWVLQTYQGLEAIAQLESLTIDVPLREIYATINLSSPADTAAPTGETNW